MEKSQVTLEYNKINGYLHKDLRTFLLTTLSVLLRMRSVPDRHVEEIE